MGRSLSTQKVINYTVLAAVMVVLYKMLVKVEPRVNKSQDIRSSDQQPGDNEGHMDVDKLSKTIDEKPMVAHLTGHKEEQFKKSAGLHFFQASSINNKTKDTNSEVKNKEGELFLEDGVDWELEEEMKKRRILFQTRVDEMEEKMADDEFKDMHETDDDFAFITAASHTTYSSTLQFVYSVQYFFPNSRIGVFDIGLTSEERQFLDSLCQTEVEMMWLQFWPDSMFNNRQRVWRPLLLQFALAKFGHFVYLEPGCFLNKQNLKPYLTHSRKHGVTVGGRQFKYSSFVVTSPHMYTFLKTNERKLQRTRHFDFTMLILHNTKRVKNYFMRYLLSCAMEDYCISPPDTKNNCDFSLANNRRYANCHRYDESAMNLILNHWHNYNTGEFLLKDGITKYYDGQDMTNNVRVCSGLKEEM